MTRGFRLRIRIFGLVAACGCFIVPIAAGAQTGMGKAEAAQLYAAAGFQIVNDQPVNRCGKPAKPRVTFVDINGDKRPEALFIDGDPSCYGFSGRYFALLVKEGAAWRQVVHGTGTAQALSSRTAGWLDLRVTESGCARDHRYDGRAYKASADCATKAPATAAQATPQPQDPGAKTAGALSAADEAAAFKAAGFKKHGAVWRSECNDPNNSGSIDSVGDLNGDGLPEALVIEGGSMCYGMTGQGYVLLTKLADGSWKVMTGGTGIVDFLKTKGSGGWPDIRVGGPGFCFPVERFNGKEYKVQRWEYDGKACKR